MPGKKRQKKAIVRLGVAGKICRAAPTRPATEGFFARTMGGVHVTVINGVGSPGPVRPGVRRFGAGGFHLPAEPAEAPCSPVSVMLTTLLAVQEAGQETAQDAGQAAVQDREAKRHGEALLTALGALQRALLGGPGEDHDPDRLDHLAALVQGLPAAADPRLAAVQRSLMLRVAVELARGQAAASV